MNVNELSYYIGAPTSLLDSLLSMQGREIIRDKRFVDLLRSVDKDLLEKTLPEARAAYAAHLPDFSNQLSKRYGLANTPMSAYTLGNWVVGALQFPDYLDTILDMHADIATEVFVGGLPELLAIVDEMPKAGGEWQRALCLLSIPLMKD